MNSYTQNLKTNRKYFVQDLPFKIIWGEGSGEIPPYGPGS